MQKPVQHNIFLDFLNPELRESWKANSLQNFDFYETVYKIAILLCKEFCILPIAFVYQDNLTFSIVEKNIEFIKANLVYLPMKESETFSSKKTKILTDYRNVKQNYKNLTNKTQLSKIEKFLEQLTEFKILKKSDTGYEIANSYQENFHKKNKYWRDIIGKYDSKTIDSLLATPLKLYYNELAITQGEILKTVNNPKVDYLDIHKLTHYEYGKVYSKEYNCVTLYNLFANFYSPTDKINFKGYDFQILSKFFKALKIFSKITKLQDIELINLKAYYETSLFINCYKNVCQNENYLEIIRYIISNNVNLKKLLEYDSVSIGKNKLDYLINVFGEFSYSINNFDKHKQIKKSKMMKILIFVALQEEEERLSTFLSMKYNSITQRYTIKKEEVIIELISPRKIGRVHSALEIYEYLIKNKANLPEMIIVAGIAGGFGKNEIKQGDILVPNYIYDISNTKKEGGTVPEERIEIFRKEPYKVNERLIKYLNSPEFDKSKCLNDIRIQTSRTEDLSLNTFKFGLPICCCDSVIKDEDWIKTILEKVDHRLTGIEMESGGICAAVEKFNLENNKNISLSVIRGVSDLANPYKADDLWRGVAMQSVGVLFKSIDFTRI